MEEAIRVSAVYEREIRSLCALTSWSGPHAQTITVRLARVYEVPLFAAARVLQALAREGVLPAWTLEPAV